MRRAGSVLRVSCFALVAASCAPQAPSASVSPVALATAAPSPSAATPPAGNVEVQPPPQLNALGAVRLAMLTVRTENGCTDRFDYFPDGGIQNLWCHRPLDFAFTALEGDAKVPVFVSGPHGRDTLKLDERNDFGHYNPAFVRWLTSSVVPARDDDFRKRSQPMYDSAASHLATVFWRVRTKINADRACFDREAQTYAALLAAHELPEDYYERWFYFMNPHFCEHEAAQAARAVASHPKGGATRLPPEPDLSWYSPRGLDGGGDGNVTKTVVGFWIRRSIDGTEGAFADLLAKVVTSYAPDLAKDTRIPAPPQLTVPPQSKRKPSVRF